MSMNMLFDAGTAASCWQPLCIYRNVDVLPVLVRGSYAAADSCIIFM